MPANAADAARFLRVGASADASAAAEDDEDDVGMDERTAFGLTAAVVAAVAAADGLGANLVAAGLAPKSNVLLLPLAFLGGAAELVGRTPAPAPNKEAAADTADLGFLAWSVATVIYIPRPVCEIASFHERSSDTPFARTEGSTPGPSSCGSKRGASRA